MIYIPLWLDSNNSINNLTEQFNQIYIPLWLDSNVKSTHALLSIKSIYIPLWLDSNYFPKCFYKILPKFTFHYGKILIQLPEPSPELSF